MLDESLSPAPEGVSPLILRFQHMHLDAGTVRARPVNCPRDQLVAGPLPTDRADLDMHPMLVRVMAAFVESIQGSEIIVQSRRVKVRCFTPPILEFGGQTVDEYVPLVINEPIL